MVKMFHTLSEHGQNGFHTLSEHGLKSSIHYVSMVEVGPYIMIDMMAKQFKWTVITCIVE